MGSISGRSEPRAEHCGKLAMNIAIIGWGSLWWCQGVLSVSGSWQPDGPWLPIEFARISCKRGHDGAPESRYLSAVLYEHAGLIKTYWIKSGMAELNDVRENLRERERCLRINCIGFVSRDSSSQFKPMSGLDIRMREWLASKPEFDAVTWTDLRSNFEKKSELKKPFTVENGIEWLAELRKKNQHDEAEKYIRKAPPQTDTCLRRRARELFAWTDLEKGIG